MLSVIYVICHIYMSYMLSVICYLSYMSYMLSWTGYVISLGAFKNQANPKLMFNITHLLNNLLYGDIFNYIIIKSYEARYCLDMLLLPYLTYKHDDPRLSNQRHTHTHTPTAAADYTVLSKRGRSHVPVLNTSAGGDL